MAFDPKTSPWTLIVLMVVLALFTLGYRITTGL